MVGTKKAVNELIEYALAELKLSEEDVCGLPSVRRAKDITSGFSWCMFYRNFVVFGFLTSFLGFLCCNLAARDELSKIAIKIYLEYIEDVTGEDALVETECLLVTPEIVLDLFRPSVDCNECKNIKQPIYTSNISAVEFAQKYAFSMQPVVILDGQTGWNAKDVFSYDYFKQLYRIQGNQTEEEFVDVCQFFPYKTEMVKNMKDFLTMPSAYLSNSSTPWYVGWSNCNGVVASKLRQHYKKPYFIPKSLDHAKTDWIFMGVPGYGAHLHIDSVDTMSWQAQIKGRKLWTLQTPPECHSQCSSYMELVVEPGNIVILDTNKWFHSTKILGDEVSIVIGSEYF